MTGTVAGEGYGYWLERDVQTYYSIPASHSNCETLTANVQPVGFLIGSTDTGKFTCSEPAGRPLYVRRGGGLLLDVRG